MNDADSHGHGHGHGHGHNQGEPAAPTQNPETLTPNSGMAAYLAFQPAMPWTRLLEEGDEVITLSRVSYPRAITIYIYPRKL